MTNENEDKKDNLDPIPSDLVQEDAAFEEVVQEFVNSLGARLDTMEKALANGDLAALKTATHQLKGSGGGHGYAILSELAAKAEQETINGNLDAVRKHLDELKILVSRVVVRLD